MTPSANLSQISVQSFSLVAHRDLLSSSSSYSPLPTPFFPRIFCSDLALPQKVAWKKDIYNTRNKQTCYSSQINATPHAKHPMISLIMVDDHDHQRDLAMMQRKGTSQKRAKWRAAKKS
jgi:hypothetical protein